MSPAGCREAIVVLGGAGGIGGAILKGLAAGTPAAQSWITYNSDAAAAEALREDVPALQLRRCDMRSAEDLRALAAEVADGAGQVRALVHAGVEPLRGPLQALPVGDVAAVVASSGVSLLSLTQAFDGLLGDGSSILYLTSAGARRAILEYGAVGVAKAAGEAIVRYLAVELAPRGVRVNALSPGAFRTRAFNAMFANPDLVLEQAARRSPRGTGLTLDEVAYVAQSLCDPRCSGVSGQVITIDGALYTAR